MRIVTVPETNLQINGLVAIGPAFSLSGILHIVVQCRCGVVKVVNYSNLRRGLLRSCGCVRKKTSSDRMRSYNLAKPRMQNGKASHPLYGIYKAMLDRCYNPTNKAYKNYGGRGVKVCDHWLGPSGIWNFVEDIGQKPSSKHSIDRIDNDGDYCPENCRWADRFAQNSNTRKTVTLTHDGKTLTLSQWARELGIGRDVLCRRRKRGLSTEEILAPVPKGHNRDAGGRWVKTT